MCDQCGRHFHSYTGIKSLIRTVHTMEFRYKCSVCDRGFDGKYYYKGHLAAHLNVTRESAPDVRPLISTKRIY
ncbi:hypothetical protein KUTeg_022294 [Tegillarca granosa]|nr:hypothetical protein KUTeg_022294 [Tegillarca granosa]